jgi:O-antigen/teichoic acid export membrane protein
VTEPDLLDSAAAGPTDMLDSAAAGPAALRGSVVRTASYVLGILLSLISAPLLVRHLGVSPFGRYVAVLSLLTIVAGFTEGGLNSIVLREFAILDAARRREMIRSAVGIRIVLTIVGVALAVAFAAAAGYGATLVLGTAIAGVGLLLQLVQSLLSTSLQAQLRFGLVSVAELLRQAVNVALLVGLILAGAGVLPLLSVAVPASAVSLIFTAVLLRGQISLRPSFHFGRWWGLLRETIPFAVISAVNIVYFRVAIVLMSVVASAVQTGYFATSFRIAEILVAIPTLVISAGFPILARAERDDMPRFEYAAERMFELALLAGVWLVVCLEVGAPFAIHVLAAHKADPAIAVLRIQGAALIATFVAVACGYPLLTLRRYRAVLASNLLALSISAALTLALAPSLGARGAAIAGLVAESGLAISTAIMLRRASAQIKLSLGAPATAALAGGLAVLAGIAAPVHPLIGIVLASAVYFAVLELLGRFPDEVGEILAGRLDWAARYPGRR